VKLKNRVTVLFIGVGALYLLGLCAGFLAPYDFAEQNRDLLYTPPSRIHFLDAHGQWHLRPYVCAIGERDDDPGTYAEDRQKCVPVQFFVRGSSYRIVGLLQSRLHLFGVEAPYKIYLLGSDGYGRDVFSRLLYGSQISLFSGTLAMALSLLIGVLLGIAAGYYGGWFDAIVMRCVELFLALPWLYLLFAIRAFLPLHISPVRTFFLILTVIGLVGWARPARLIRGVALSGKERGYVLAARTFGGSNLYLMRRHLLPQAYSILLTQAALLIPQYILAEVTLSFLGLGVGEPVPTWGNMLSTLQQYDVLISYWWMWAPGLILIPVFLIYQFLGNALQESADCSVYSQ
jgi:peptide/nickel transport system permease protein